MEINLLAENPDDSVKSLKFNFDSIYGEISKDWSGFKRFNFDRIEKAKSFGVENELPNRVKGPNSMIALLMDVRFLIPSGTSILGTAGSGMC